MAEVIVALDQPSVGAALELVDTLGEAGTFYKVGLELFSRGGPQVVRELRERGKRVFLDLKLHDIPNTVAGAVAAASALDVELVTVHAAGGPEMMEAARNAAAGDTRVVAVTLLTSLSAADVETLWGREIRSIRDEVVRLAHLVRDQGLHGVVASPLEAEWVRRSLPEPFLLVTPGIRMAGGDAGDQKRVATPAGAVEAGADCLVVGRTVTAAPDPELALRTVWQEVASASDS
ncbi:MAG: orotidine-5'-phosphate decarboxylase [Gemmatimonadota bacterium]